MTTALANSYYTCSCAGFPALELVDWTGVPEVLSGQ